MAGLRVTLLGGFSLQHDSGTAVALPGPRARALVAYLALQHGRVQPRDKLAALLWPDASHERARHNLRQLLLLVRQTLPVGTLQEPGEDVGLDPAGLGVDALEFERLATAKTSPAALSEAVGLYGGDLLAGLGEQSTAFEEWLLAERERLRDLALHALARLLDHHLEIDADQGAIQIAGKLLALDAAHEPAHRALMRVHIRQGRRTAALRQYQLCVAALRRELGAEPETETKQLYQQLLRRHAPSPVATDASASRRQAVVSQDAGRLAAESSTHDAPIVGRGMELERLRAAVEDGWTGHGQVWLVTGEAGIGKTRLIEEIAGDVIRRGGRTIVGRCYESTQIFPFGPWVDALRSDSLALGGDMAGALPPVWRSELARLFPDVAGSALPPASDDFLRLFESVAQLFERLLAAQAIVLVLEDVHWADEMSLRLLAFLARRSTRRLAIVATAREEELLDAPALRLMVQELGREARLSGVKVPPLSRDDTVSLMRTLARRGSDAASGIDLEEHVWAASEGNPLMVVETIRALEEGGRRGGPESALPLPARVREIVAGRLERLSPQSRHLAAVAAVIGRGFDFALVQRAADLSEWQAAESVEELVRRRILRGGREGFEFTHDRIRDVAYAELLPPRRRILHARVADALESLYGDDRDSQCAMLAGHCREAELWAKAVVYSRRAGAQAAARSAHEQAVMYFERALEALAHLDHDDATRAEAIDTRFELRTSLVALGQLERVLGYLREAEDLVKKLEDEARRGWIAVYMAHHYLMTGSVHAADDQARVAAAVATATRDFGLRIGATHYAGWARLARAEHDRAEECFVDVIRSLAGERVHERCGLTGFPAVMARWLLATSYAERGRLDDAMAHAREGIRIAESVDHAFSRILALWACAYASSVKGEFAEAGRLHERALGVAREFNISFLAPFVTAHLGFARAREGDVRGGVALIEDALEVFDRSPYRVFHSLFVTYQAEAYLLAGRLDDAGRTSERALGLARERGERGVEAWALRLSAEVASHPDRLRAEQASWSFRTAMARAGELGLRPLVAHCHLGLGRLYRTLHDEARARSELVAAAEEFRALTMDLWSGRARASLGEPT